MALLRGKTAYRQHADLQAWLAWRDGEVVGRISAQRDHLHPQPEIGQFGFLDAIDDQAVFEALFTTAAEWLSQRGATQLQGPFDPSINAQTGLLVDGFETPPYLMMGHAEPYYQRRYREHGLEPCQDLLAYMLDSRFTTPKAMARLARHYRSSVRIREPDWRNRAAELSTMRDIFNDAWQDNWGFVPYTEAEFHELGEHLKLLIKPGWAHIVEYQDEPIAFIVVLPNINEMITDLNGRLLPFGVFKLLYRLKLQPIRSARVPLMGVRKHLQGTPMAGAIAYMMIEQLQLHTVMQGLRDVELSWILRSNKGMRSILERITATPYKTYQVFGMPL